MNDESYRAYEEFKCAQRIEKDAEELLYRKALGTMRALFNENREKPIHFAAVYCEDKDGEYLGDFTTLDMRDGLRLCGDKDGNGYLDDHTKISHKDLEKLLNAIILALE